MKTVSAYRSGCRVRRRPRQASCGARSNMPCSRRLIIEHLEDRALLATLVPSGGLDYEETGDGYISAIPASDWGSYPGWGIYSCGGAVMANGDEVGGEIGTSARVVFGGSMTIDTVPGVGEAVGDSIAIRVSAEAEALSSTLPLPQYGGTASYVYSASAPAGGGTLISGQLAGRLWDLPLRAGEHVFLTTIGTPFQISFSMAANVVASGLQSATLSFWFCYEVDILPLGGIDMTAQSIVWDPAGPGATVAFDYGIIGEDVSEDTAIDFYWSRSESPDDRIGSPVHQYAIDSPSAKTVGTHSHSMPSTDLGERPEDATHVVMVVDPEDTVDESLETNNSATGEIRNEPPVVENVEAEFTGRFISSTV